MRRLACYASSSRSELHSGRSRASRRDHGLIFYDKIPEGDANPEEVIWASRDAATRLHRLVDRFAGITYLVVDDADEASLAVGAIEELDGLSLATLLDAVAVDPKAARDLTVIAALGVLAPPSFEPRVFDEFSRLLADEEPAIRARTISAIACPSWPEFVPLLEAMASDDPHDEVRSRASVALAAFLQHLSGAT
ncbi:HEAT repeat domain-containing protein [Nannocystis radixulma]|uniref:HEAT repeat domain-containing protein n=1 Tax=Nannocystis radixulma TaxID=2995305 RepID=A0ABT5B3Z2_9BACT|nr:HEAT repeat domain-containing protein [Nannocystis radixulma]MDC0668395.1 HEAT repeat domain-containing protein [Nannocystis radixulma]